MEGMFPKFPPLTTSLPRLRRWISLTRLNVKNPPPPPLTKIGDTIPETSEWLEAISGSDLNWLKALLTSKTISQGRIYIDNPLRRTLALRRGQRIMVDTEDGLQTSAKVYGAGRSCGPHKADFKAVEIAYTASSGLIDVTFFEDRQDVSVPLFFQFKYAPSMGSIPIHEVSEGRNVRIKDFYWKLWFWEDRSRRDLDVHETFIGPEAVISAEDVENFCNASGTRTRHSRLRMPKLSKPR
jgi:fatty acid synthase subunit alpha, fungi type